nr:O-antigen ligase family protein [Spartinivicinus marinus]
MSICNNIIHKFVKNLFIAIVVIGVFLTFSRASVVSLVFSYILYVFFLIISNKYDINKTIVYFLYSIFVSVLIILMLFFLFPMVAEFFSLRLFQFLSNFDSIEENISNSATSEGTRFAIWKYTVIYVLNSPFFGSGYLGIWAIQDNFGSVHNQYFDVLLRTGILGFLIYIYMLLKIGKKLYRNRQSMFFGYVGVIVFGLFHETFKESQGLFILSFILLMSFKCYDNISSNFVD